MKLYILIHLDQFGDNHTTIGIFDSHKKARDAIIIDDIGFWCSYDIEEFKLNQVN
tara:strand:- start:191 stop:355 length:165 start_codon:yes stop_codon:yes gene_type:complete